MYRRSTRCLTPQFAPHNLPGPGLRKFSEIHNRYCQSTATQHNDLRQERKIGPDRGWDVSVSALHALYHSGTGKCCVVWLRGWPPGSSGAPLETAAAASAMWTADACCAKDGGAGQPRARAGRAGSGPTLSFKLAEPPALHTPSCASASVISGTRDCSRQAGTHRRAQLPGSATGRHQGAPVCVS